MSSRANNPDGAPRTDSLTGSAPTSSGAPADAAPGPVTELAELQRRLVFSMLRPAVRLCRHFSMPMKTLVELCKLAYFEEMRARGDASQAEIARVFGRSLRSVGMLEQQYRGDFLAPEREMELGRRVEMLLEDGPLTLEGLLDKLGDAEADRDEVERVLRGLVGSGRATASQSGDAEHFSLHRDFVSLVKDDFHARVDGLNHQLDVIVAAVRDRFMGNGSAPKSPSLARTLSFVSDEDAVRVLGEALARELRERCGDAEEEALRSEGGYERFAVTIAIAPLDR